MSAVKKRWWSPRQDFEGAYKDTLQFLQRCKEHNVISPTPPALFYSYKIEGHWPTEGMLDISRFLRFGYDKNPTTDETRQILARLLSVALKTHFFLNEKAIVVHEPYLFSIPDLSQSGKMRYGLIYPIEENKGNTVQSSTIIVSEWDTSLNAAHQPRLSSQDKFPVVLASDPFKWLGLKHWRNLKSESTHQPWSEHSSIKERSIFFDSIQKHTDIQNFPYGTILNFDISLREDIKMIGGMWANGIKKWFLPIGWDTEAVIDYLNHLNSLNENQRNSFRWWSERSRQSSKPIQTDKKN